MDLVYTDKEKVDIGILHGYDFDLAFGVDENDFELRMDLSSHCCSEDCLIYTEGAAEDGTCYGTEYGGIIDKIKSDTESQTVIYKGRTWHGILENKIIEPEGDYLILYGEANEVLADLMERLDLQDLFSVSTEDSGIEIIAYQMERYVKGYTGICSMLAEAEAKLRMEYRKGKVVLYAVPLIDYSQDEEWDDSQLDFSVERNYNPVNHMICAGQGDLEERYVIHLFTDENGGLQQYAKTENPLQDSDYIIDKSQQLVFGAKEVTEFYDVSNAEITENYILCSKQPSDWTKNYANYYSYDEESEKYKEVEGEKADKYSILSKKPSDWDDNYAGYYIKEEGEYRSVSALGKTSYSKMSKKPSDWTKNYGNYYYYYSDGVTTEYRTVEGIEKNRYRMQTRKPTDWSSNYKNYYKRKKKGGFEKIDSKKVPKWTAKKYYTRYTYYVTPKFISDKYYRKKITTSVPSFTSNKYYEKTEIENTPHFMHGEHYYKVLDHYAVMVQDAIKKIEENSLNCDEIDIDLSSTGQEYDIGDIVGATESVTGISVFQSVKKKIVKITEEENPVITYEVGNK